MSIQKPLETPSKRMVRALTSAMSVLDELAPPPADAPGLCMVVSDSGRAYIIDVEDGACECADMRYNNPDEGCAHLLRARIVRGDLDVPDWVDLDDVDDQLRRRLEASR